MHPSASALAVLALVSAAACGGKEGRPSFSDPAQPISVAAGSEFDLALKSNQSTGYQWVLVDSAALGPLRFVSKDYVIPREYRDNNGAGGTERWIFRGQSAGDGVVALVYKRPWESVPPIESVRFRVTVR
jgi:inhibitor of cysteine peptidase